MRKNEKDPFTIQLWDNKILAKNEFGDLVDATPENGMYIKRANIEIGYLDENGQPIPEDEQKKRNQKHYSDNAAIRTEGKDFVFVMTNPDNKFAKELKFETLTRLLMLSTYLSFAESSSPSMLILGNKFGQKRPMKKSDIQSVLGLSKSTFYDFMKEVSPDIDDNGSIVNTPYLFNVDGVYYMNNEYFLRSYLPKGSHHYINKIFVTPVRRLYQIAKISQHRKLGMIFALLPYINREWNIVCWNTLEDDLAYIEAMSTKDICEVLGLSRKHANRTIDGMIREVMRISLKIDGVKQYFCALVETDERKQMIINPNFIYIGKRVNEIMQTGAFFVATEDIDEYRRNMSISDQP